MSTKANKQLIQKFFEALNQRELGILEALLTPNFVWHGNVDQSREDYRKDLQGVIAAFPDAKWIVEDLLADEDKVVIRWTFHGTHAHNWESTAATGKQITYGGISICRLLDGKVAEVWNNENLLSLYRQLGFQVNPTQKRKWWK
jgi:steroid delta-isomerase-like uncharacterized protein